MVGMGRVDTTVQFCNSRQAALPMLVPQWGMVPLGGGNLVPWRITVLLWDGEAENLNKVAGQPWTACEFD